MKKDGAVDNRKPSTTREERRREDEEEVEEEVEEQEVQAPVRAACDSLREPAVISTT